eukprot:jgi/Picsp_1/2291/NSC_05755-R1_nucleotidyltransferase family protein
MSGSALVKVKDDLGFQLLRESLYKGLEWDVQHTKLPVTRHVSTLDAVKTLLDCQKNCSAILDAFRIDELEDLEKMLRQMVYLTTPTEEDDSKREACLRRLEGSLPYVKCKGIESSSLRLLAFGSFVSGLYSKNGDLDVSLHGHVKIGGGKNSGPVPVSILNRSLQKRILNSLFRCTIRNPLFVDSTVLLRARVPIIKYLDVRSQVACDVAVARDDGRFKSVALKVLSQIDWRFSALVRLIKMWASEHKVNDASQGTLNSFSLILLVIFHLQNRPVPVLPPLFLLLSYKGDTVKRPMKYELDTRNLILEEMVGKSLDWRSKRSKTGTNRETLLELVMSFFHIIKGLTVAWGQTENSSHYSMCHVRVDTWGGQLKHGAWPKSRAVCSIEDPFDAQENCSRAVQLHSQLRKIQLAAERSIQSLSVCHRDTEIRKENVLIGAFGHGIVRSAQKQQAACNNVLLKPGKLVLRRAKLPIEIASIKDKDLFTRIAIVNHASFEGFEDWSAWNLSKMENCLVNDSPGTAGSMVQSNGMVSSDTHSNMYNVQYMATDTYLPPPGLVPPPPPDRPNQTVEMHSMILELESIGLDGKKATQSRRKKKTRRWNRGPRKSALVDQKRQDYVNGVSVE